MGHLGKTKAMAGYAASQSVPVATPLTVLTVLTGVQILLGGSGSSWVWGDLGALLVVVFLVGTAALMHAIWRESEPMNRQLEIVHFNKDVALAGAALAFFWVFSNDPG